VKVIRRRFAVPLIVLALSLVELSADAMQSSPLRVLFIGNSYTYFNNLPCLVSELARARGRTIETRDAPRRDQLAITRAFEDAARKLGATVIPPAPDGIGHKGNSMQRSFTTPTDRIHRHRDPIWRR
jgi:hypothetical protein